jgi:hypothetical protein
VTVHHRFREEGMMSRWIVAVCSMAVLIGGGQASVAQADALIDKLQAIPGLTIVQEKPTPTGGRYFVLTLAQPINHLKPWKGTFLQRLSLYHQADDRPVVFFSGGYRIGTNPSRNEVTQIVDGNQINIEHRFFLPSRPDPADWDDLTIFQQASDDHHVVQAFRTLYPGRWLRVGNSKGGMQATYHTRFYPHDVDGLIAYSPPHDVIDSHDAYASFLEHVGSDPACRENLKALQREALIRRDEIVPMMIAETAPDGFTYDRVFGSADKALELAVIELPFTFWQTSPQESCDFLPTFDAALPTSEVYANLFFIQPLTFWTDDFILTLTPYYYQSGTQIGYPKVADDSLADLLRYPGADVPRSFVPPEIDMPPYEWWVMVDIDLYVRLLGRRQMFVYGELDPWSAEPYHHGGARRDSWTYTVPGGNHLAPIATLPAASRAAATATIRRWAGL